jgi:hypothetical protein
MPRSFVTVRRRAMKAIGRLTRVAILVLLGTVLAGPPAMGRSSKVLGMTLVPPPVEAPEPQASGQWTQTRQGLSWVTDDVAVRCKGLTPGEQYSVVAYVFWMDQWGGYGWEYSGTTLTADRKGQIAGQFSILCWESYINVEDLWIENGQGEIVLETRR